MLILLLIVSSLFAFDVVKAQYNPHKSPIPSVDFYRTNSSKLSCADQDVVSDKNNHSYDGGTSYPIDSVFSQESKLLIGIDVSTNNLKAPSTPLKKS